MATPEFVLTGLVIVNRGLSKAADPVHRGRVEKLLLPLWYMQLGWPDRFGLSKDQGRELLARFKNVVQAFGITNESEGSIGNMSRFLADTDARYRRPAGRIVLPGQCGFQQQFRAAGLAVLRLV